jgi:hypothetical protein
MRVFSTVIFSEGLRARQILRVVIVALLALVVCVSATRVGAQTTNATINGQITDAQGKIVPGVDVQAVNIETGVTYSGKTNDSGIYVIPALLPGPYRLVVKKDGFREINKVGIVLHVQDTLEQNFALEVGSVTESITVGAAEGTSQGITVYGEGINMNTTDASVSTVIDRQFVENIPLNGRSLQDLLALVPGVAIVGNAGNGMGAESRTRQRF